MIRNKIRVIENYPIANVKFKDICPLLEDAKSFKESIDLLCALHKKHKIDKIIGIEARGFVFASAMAYKLGTGLVMVRKKDKLPYKKNQINHTMEYGMGTVEMHIDSVLPGEKVVIVDDVLATGGTMEATMLLLEQNKSDIISMDFVIELTKLKGRAKLKDYKINSLIKYGK